MHKKFAALLIIAIVLLSGCGSSYVSDKDIISNEDSYTYQSCNDAGSTSDSLNRVFEGFKGKDTVFILDAEEEASVTTKISIVLNKGKVKIVLVTNNNNIVILLENNGIYEQCIELEAGISRIIMVGDNSSGTCQITFSEFENVTVKNISGGMGFDDWFDDWF